MSRTRTTLVFPTSLFGDFTVVRQVEMNAVTRLALGYRFDVFEHSHAAFKEALAARRRFQDIGPAESARASRGPVRGLEATSMALSWSQILFSVI